MGRSKKKLHVPVFPNYVFVKVNKLTRGYLYSINEMVRFVSIDKKPVVVREDEIMTIRKALSQDEEVLIEDSFQEGMKVRIIKGHFAGLEGLIVKRNNSARLLIIKLDGLLKRSLSIFHLHGLRRSRIVRDVMNTLYSLNFLRFCMI